MYKGCLEVGLDRYAKVGETAFVSDNLILGLAEGHNVTSGDLA